MLSRPNLNNFHHKLCGLMNNAVEQAEVKDEMVERRI